MGVWRRMAGVVSIVIVTSVTGSPSLAQEEAEEAAPAPQAAEPATDGEPGEDQGGDPDAAAAGGGLATNGSTEVGSDDEAVVDTATGTTPSGEDVPGGVPASTDLPLGLDRSAIGVMGAASGPASEPVVAQALSTPVDASLLPAGTPDEKLRQAEADRDAAKRAFDEARARSGGEIPGAEHIRLIDADSKLATLRQDQAQQNLQSAAQAAQDAVARGGRASPEAVQAQEQFAQAYRAYQAAQPREALNAADPLNLPRMVAEDLRTRGITETANRYFVPGAAAPINFANGVFQSAARTVPRVWQSLAVSRWGANEADRQTR